MPRRSIEDLASAPAGFPVDLETNVPGSVFTFETLESCVHEDEVRRRALKAYLSTGMGGRKWRRALRLLLCFYDAVLAGKPRRLSAASRVQMRDWRARISGWLWSLIEPLEATEWMFFTIVLPSWWSESGKLQGVKAKRLMERLRVALHRAGSGHASGWLYAMLDSEFDGDTDGFSIHVHGIATEGMIQVLRRLRQQRQFKRNENDRRRYPHVSISRKLRIDRPRDNYAKIITYASKSMWRQHNSRVDLDGERRRIGQKHRIIGSARLRLLRWLHREKIKDQVLLVHLSVVGGALVPGKRGDRQL